MRFSFKTIDDPTTQIPDIDEGSVFRWRYHDPETGELIEQSEPMSPSAAMALDLNAQAILGTHEIRRAAGANGLRTRSHRDRSVPAHADSATPRLH